LKVEKVFAAIVMAGASMDRSGSEESLQGNQAVQAPRTLCHHERMTQLIAGCVAASAGAIGLPHHAN
jgi:hypothetical protein